jgi:hypothetical protein
MRPWSIEEISLTSRIRGLLASAVRRFALRAM